MKKKPMFSKKLLNDVAKRHNKYYTPKYWENGGEITGDKLQREAYMRGYNEAKGEIDTKKSV